MNVVQLQRGKLVHLGNAKSAISLVLYSNLCWKEPISGLICAAFAPVQLFEVLWWARLLKKNVSAYQTIDISHVTKKKLFILQLVLSLLSVYEKNTRLQEHWILIKTVVKTKNIDRYLSIKMKCFTIHSEKQETSPGLTFGVNEPLDPNKPHTIVASQSNGVQ